MFGDISKEKDRKEVDHLSKGIIVGISGSFGFGSLDPIKYKEIITYAPPSTLGTKTYNRSTDDNSYTAFVQEAYGIYRYKSFGLGLGLSQINISSTQHYTSFSGVPGSNFDNKIKITSLQPKFYFCSRIFSKAYVEITANLGIPISVSTSSDYSVVSSDLNYGGEFAYRLGVYKGLALRLGFKVTHFGITYDEFNYTRNPFYSSVTNSTSVFDYSENKGTSSSSTIMGLMIGVQYNFNHLIK